MCNPLFSELRQYDPKCTKWFKVKNKRKVKKNTSFPK